MASNGTIAHRFANRDYNFERGLKGGSTHIEGNNYYSYNTVFGQWVDTKKKVCLVFYGNTSITSHKHKLYSSIFPDDVTILPYDDGGGSMWDGGWHGCDLMGYSKDFNLDKRMILIDHYISNMLTAIKDILNGKKKDLDKIAARNISINWEYILKLCSLYKDTTIPKYIERASGDKKRLASAIYTGTTDIPALTDIINGYGTWKAYYSYCGRFRKAADKRAKIEALCERLGVASPYESWTRGRMDTGLTADQIRKLSAKERVELHFKALSYKEYKEHEDEREKKYNKNFRNAYKWIVGLEPKKKSWGGGYESDVHNCINKGSGVVYVCSGEYISRFYWCDTSVSFDYDSFRKSEDKEQWIREFYSKCKEVADNRKAISILRWAKANTREKVHSYDDDIYILDEKLTDIGMDAESLAIVTEFIRKQDKYFADEEARRRAREIERLRKEEEERKEREYMEQVKQEQIVECLKDGSEGCRNLWRRHLTSLLESENRYSEVAFESDGDFFYKGNVLLRFNLNKDKVETSKSIRIPVEVCKKMWKIVSKWHENPSCFKEMQIDTKGSGRYTISSYQNDIMTAGCHKIAYAEMKRMYNEIVSLENVA